MRYRIFLAALYAVLSLAAHLDAADKPVRPLFPAASNADAWNRLPRKQPALPVWARVLSKSLPKTTAAILRLDYLHRADNPLDPVLRGKLRFVAALANRCEYSVWYADYDLRRAGLTPKQRAAFLGDWKKLPAKERIALEFARKMTIAAHTVTDKEFAALLKAYGPETVTAMVHTLAYANFQDRIFLALEIAVEKGGPLPPLDADFDEQELAKIKVPKRKPWKQIERGKIVAPKVKLEWKKRSHDQIRKLLAAQKKRTGRMPPPKSGPRTPIAWATISLGYQPVLTQEWFRCMSTFQEEMSLDEVFSNSMFWVITRSNECFY